MTKAHPQTWQRPHPDLSVFVLEQLIEAPFCGQLLTDFSAEDMVFAFNESGKSAGMADMMSASLSGVLGSHLHVALSTPAA